MTDNRVPDYRSFSVFYFINIVTGNLRFFQFVYNFC